MKFNFNWTNKDDEFNPANPCSNGVDVFDLSISQKEGLFATALVTIKNPYPEGKSLEKEWCHITWGEQLLFKGCLASSPKCLDKGLMQLKFIARCENFRQVFSDATIELKTGCDDLFHEDMQPADVLQARSELFYCDRRDHSVRLSNIFNGNHYKDLGGNFLYDSFNMSIANTPLRAVDVEVIAQWHQEFTDRIDMSHYIANRSPHGMLSTLNGSNWKERWWQTGQKLTGSNYRVYYANLTEVKPPRTGALNIYPRISESFQVNGKQQQLQRCWFKPELVVSYTYKQKRQETARFCLEQNIQGAGLESSRKQLTIRLQKLIDTNQVWQPGVTYYPGARAVYGEYVYQCETPHVALDSFESAYWTRLRRGMHISDQSHAAAFFTSDRGAKALNYAHKIAQAYLANSSRAVKISLRGRLEDLHDITTDHSLRICDPRIPGTTVTGKVSAYDIRADGVKGTRYVDVQMLLAVGSDSVAVGAVEQDFTYVSDGYVEADASELLDNYANWQYDGAPQGLDNPLYYHNQDFIEWVEIKNDAGEQNQLLAGQEFTNQAELEQFMDEHATRVSFRLKNLSTKNCCARVLNLQPKTKYTPPKQISVV